MKNRVLVAGDRPVSVGDEVYIVVCNTTGFDGGFYLRYETISHTTSKEASTPYKYYAKKVIVNSFDSGDVYISDGNKPVAAVSSDRVFPNKKSAMIVALRYQEFERDERIRLCKLSKDMVLDLKKEIANL